MGDQVLERLPAHKEKTFWQYFLTNKALYIMLIPGIINLLAFKEQALKDEELTPLQTILITSAMPHEGKSMVAANLAQTVAERGQTVFLVESDLRRPTLARVVSTSGRARTAINTAENTCVSARIVATPTPRTIVNGDPAR